MILVFIYGIMFSERLWISLMGKRARGGRMVLDEKDKKQMREIVIKALKDIVLPELFEIKEILKDQRETTRRSFGGAQ